MPELIDISLETTAATPTGIEVTYASAPSIELQLVDAPAQSINISLANIGPKGDPGSGGEGGGAVDSVNGHTGTVVLTASDVSADASGAAATALTSARSYADSLASNYDAAGAASTAQSTAESYADSLVTSLVPNTRTVNGHALSANVTVTKSDLSISNVDNTSDANKPVSTAQQTALDLKVDKVTGKVLSTNDYTDSEKTKLAGIAADATNVTALSVLTDDSTHRLVSDTEKSTWNAKQDALGFTAVPNTRSISTTAPITGGGTLAADRTLAIAKATTSVDGYLSATDWTTFNAKAPAVAVGTYSTRTGLSPSNGLEFFQTDDGRDSPAGKYFYLNSTWNYIPMRQEAFWSWFDDFSSIYTTNASSNGIVSIISGTGASLASTNSTGDAWLGRWMTGTTTTGFVQLKTGGSAVGSSVGFKASTATMYFKLQINALSALSDGTNTYTIEAGFSSNANNHPGSIGYLFYYAQAASNNWLYRNGNGSLTDTGVTATTGAALLEVFVNATTATYWINGTQVASAATVSGTTAVAPVVNILKSAGTTNVTMDTDYLKIWARLLTTRN